MPFHKSLPIYFYNCLEGIFIIYMKWKEDSYSFIIFHCMVLIFSITMYIKKLKVTEKWYKWLLRKWGRNNDWFLIFGKQYLKIHLRLKRFIIFCLSSVIKLNWSNVNDLWLIVTNFGLDIKELFSQLS